MKTWNLKTLLAVVAWMPSLWTHAAPVYRCGDVYTNQRVAGQHCQPVTGGQVSVLGQATEPPVRARSSAPALPPPTVDTASRAAAAQAVLQAELTQAQERLVQAQADLGRGDQAAAQSVARAQVDVQSLQREMVRWSRRQP